MCAYMYSVFSSSPRGKSLVCGRPFLFLVHRCSFAVVLSIGENFKVRSEYDTAIV